MPDQAYYDALVVEAQTLSDEAAVLVDSTYPPLAQSIRTNVLDPLKTKYDRFDAIAQELRAAGQPTATINAMRMPGQTAHFGNLVSVPGLSVRNIVPATDIYDVAAVQLPSASSHLAVWGLDAGGRASP